MLRLCLSRNGWNLLHEMRCDVRPNVMTVETGLGLRRFRHACGASEFVPENSLREFETKSFAIRMLNHATSKCTAFKSHEWEIRGHTSPVPR
jgi:hypothetical protein